MESLYVNDIIYDAFSTFQKNIKALICMSHTWAKDTYGPIYKHSIGN